MTMVVFFRIHIAQSPYIIWENSIKFTFFLPGEGQNFFCGVHRTLCRTALNCSQHLSYLTTWNTRMQAFRALGILYDYKKGKHYFFPLLKCGICCYLLSISPQYSSFTNLPNKITCKNSILKQPNSCIPKCIFSNGLLGSI